MASISLLGLSIRCAFIWFGARGDGPVGDQLFYSAQAIANARGDWFEQPFAEGMPAADHPPLTALVLTPLTWVVEQIGSVVTFQRLLMALIGTFSIVVMALLGRSVGGRAAGLVSAGVTAVYVNVWINDGLIMAETLTFLLIALLTMATLRLCDALRDEERTDVVRERARYAVLGFLVGLAGLTRPELVVLALLLAVLVAVLTRRRVGWQGVAARLAILLAATGVVLAPWVIWNQARFDGPAFLSTNDGLTIAGGNCATTYYADLGGWDIWCAYATDVPDGYDAAQASALMRADGLDYWRENLDRYPVVAAARLARVFSVGFFNTSAEASVAEGRPVWLSHIGTVQYWALVPLALMGARRRATTLQRVVLLGTVPIVIAVAMVANAYVRFRVPAEVGLIVLASLGCTSLRFERLRSRLG